MIDRFDGQYRFLSNFYPAPIFYEGISYPSVEHAYQAAKTADLEIRMKIAELLDAWRAKKIGRIVPLRPEWDSVKLDVMRALIALKFPVKHNGPEPIHPLSYQLMNTHMEKLVEGNTWHDTFWGRCYCDDHSGVGHNWLGQILTAQRDVLISHYNWTTTFNPK